MLTLVFIGFCLFFMQNRASRRTRRGPPRPGFNAIIEGYKSAFGLPVPLDLPENSYIIIRV
jgi:hypothetical protein